MAATVDRYKQALSMLKRFGQEHVLKFYDELDDAGRERLLSQVEQYDWECLAEAVQTHVVREPEIELPQRIEPVDYYPIAPGSTELQRKYAEARKLGENLIREGKVAAFTVAGGQGTRLGWDGPKGTYPATPIENKPLFQVFAEFIIKTQRKYEATVPWLIMTSPLNDADTRAFFEQHKHFGLDPANVIFFPQNTVPSFSLDGKALLAAKDQIASNPDGHGGSLRALYTSRALHDLEERGVEQISYFQVDNPLVKCVDPLFIGLHVLDGAGMSSKMLTKAGPLEKVGNFCMADGRVTVIEYSDMPNELAEQRNADGSLRFNAGSIAIHVIATAFVKRLNAGRFALPWHRAVKKVPHIDMKTGEAVEPGKPNAVKLETFVFDALPLAERSSVLETLREEEFAPIKNAEGVDSAVTSKQLQSDRAARWLAAAGVEVERNAVVELSHLTAVEPEDLKRGGVKLPRKIEAGSRTSL